MSSQDETTPVAAQSADKPPEGSQPRDAVRIVTDVIHKEHILSPVSSSARARIPQQGPALFEPSQTSSETSTVESDRPTLKPQPNVGLQLPPLDTQGAEQVGNTTNLSPEIRSGNLVNGPVGSQSRAHSRRLSNVSINVLAEGAETPRKIFDPLSQRADDNEASQSLYNDDSDRGSSASSNHDESVFIISSGSSSAIVTGWEQPFPVEVDLDLHISFDDINVHRIERGFAWWNPIMYEKLQELKTNFMNKFMEANSIETHKQYYRHGRFRVCGTKHATPYIPLDQETELKEKAITYGCGFVHDYTYERFGMEVYWDFSSHRIQPGPTADFCDMISSEVTRKIRRNFDDEQYVSRADLRWLSGLEIIKQTIDHDRKLREWSSKERELFAKQVVLVGASRLLVACVLAGRSLLYLSHLMNCPEKYRDAKPPTERHECSDEECSGQLGELNRSLHRFFAHTFDEEKNFLPLGHNDVVPIQYDEGKHEIGAGAGGVVHRVKIDPAHHYFYGDRATTFALKIFNDSENKRRHFTKEHRMLQELAKFPHAHIVPHLASWTRRGRSYILYPLAKYNLRKFMEVNKQPPLTAPIVIWFLSQLRGLADAIRNIHFLGGPRRDTVASATLGPELNVSGIPEKTGFHHDIKPENILVFEDDREREQRPILKISDFGASKFSKREPGHSSHQISKTEGTLTYDGPDLDMKIKASRPWDIWAAGCVFLEFLSWLFLPYQTAVEGFGSDRMNINGPERDLDRFWHRTDEGRWALRPAVEKRLQELERNHCNGRRALFDVVGMIRKCLTIEPSKRIKAETLLDGLDAIVKQAENDLKTNPTLYSRSLDGSHTPPPLKIALPVDPSDGHGRRRSIADFRDMHNPAESPTRRSRADREEHSISNLGKGPRLESLLQSDEGTEASDPDTGMANFKDDPRPRTPTDPELTFAERLILRSSEVDSGKGKERSS